MSKAAMSLRIFGVYLMLLGVGLVVAPNPLLSLFGLAPTGEVWIHVVGLLVFNIGIYYWFAAPSEWRPLFAASIVARVLVLAAFSAFALLGMAKPVLILFGAVDAAGALWTWLALRPAPAAVSA
jgi:hypothetical protein